MFRFPTIMEFSHEIQKTLLGFPEQQLVKQQMQTHASKQREHLLF